MAARMDFFNGLTGGWVAPAFSGLLLSLAFPTSPGHPMAWAHGSPWAFVALLPLFSCLPRPAWNGFRCGWVTGFVFSLYSLYWVAFTQGGGPAVVAGTLLMAGYIGLFYGLAGAGLSAAVKAWPHAGWLAAPLLWTGAEYLLALGELGFPWLLLGSTQAVTVEFIQYAEITGVYGVSFWTAAVNVVLWLTLRASGLRPRMAGAAALLALFACPWWYSASVIDSTPGEPGLRVGLVQNNLGLEKWHRGGLERSFITLEHLSREAAAQGPDLLVWPETAVPCRLRTREDCSSRVEELVAELGVPVLTGASDADPHTREPYNAAFYFTEGRPPQRYAKMHLVPFGERTPFMDYVPLLRDIDWTALTGDLGPAEFARGRERTLFEHPARRLRGADLLRVGVPRPGPPPRRRRRRLPRRDHQRLLVRPHRGALPARAAGGVPGGREPHRHRPLRHERGLPVRRPVRPHLAVDAGLHRGARRRRPRRRVAPDLLQPPRRPVRPARHRRGLPCGNGRHPALQADRLRSWKPENESGNQLSRAAVNLVKVPVRWQMARMGTRIVGRVIANASSADTP